jgi:hypothetical protein
MKHLVISLNIYLVILAGCSIEEDVSFLTVDGGIVALTDTVSFDTLIAGRESFVKRVRLYNQSEENLTVTNIGLRNRAASSYQIIINGQTAKNHVNTQIAANDSLLVLVSINPEGLAGQWIREVSDRIEWIDPLSTDTYSIALQAWAITVQEKEKSFICDETWLSSSAVLVKDTLVVAANCTLNIEPGVKVFFEPNAVLFVAGSLHVKGFPEDRVVFRGSRLDGAFRQALGMWNGIYFLEGSDQSTISNAIIENSQTGLRLGTPDSDTIPDLLVENTIIRHSSQFGIQAYSSDLQATNVLIYDIGFIPAFHAIGGNYSYDHCTISNFPSQVGSQETSMIFADHLVTNEGNIWDMISLSLTNSIIWTGLSETDLQISLIDAEQAEITVLNNIIHGPDVWEGNLTDNAFDFIHFQNPFDYNYRLDSISPAINSSILSELTFDLDGKPRDSIPDLGAYEYVY